VEQLAASEYNDGMGPLDVVGSWMLSTDPLVMAEVVDMIFPEEEVCC
jgi:hypothetical protein